MEPYNRAIVSLREAGVFDHILSGYKLKALPINAKHEGLMVLRIEHYEGPFYLLTIFLCIDVLIFILELLTMVNLKSIFKRLLISVYIECFV